MASMRSLTGCKNWAGKRFRTGMGYWACRSCRTVRYWACRRRRAGIRSRTGNRS